MLSLISLVASNDSKAQDVLDKTEERKIAMDGNFTAQRYCVVMSRSDDMDTQDYMAEHPELESEMKGELAAAARLDGRIIELEGNITNGSKSLHKHAGSLESFAKQIQSLEKNGKLPHAAKKRCGKAGKPTKG